MQPQAIKIEFSIKSILLVLATLAGLWFAIQLKSIIIIIFVAFILTAAIQPIAVYLNRFKIPQVISLAIAYIVAISLIVALGFMLLPPLVSQVEAFIRQLPDFTSRAITVLAGAGVSEGQAQQYIDATINYLTSKLEGWSSNVLELGLGLVNGILTLVTVMVISFYILIEKNRLYEGLSLIISPRRYSSVRPLIDRIEVRLGSWVRGQLLLGLIIGLTTWVGLSLLQIPYALPLAIIAGLFELIPLIGPILSAIPTVVVALTISPTMAIAVVVLYLVIQQLESNLIVPKVMQKAVGLNPLFILLAILAGSAVMGIIGALLAIPVAVVVATILEEMSNATNDKPSVAKASAKSK